jgi:molybdenum cofactor guanylyltransferase
MRSDLGAVLLAGGKSTRMGTPKGWLEFDGRPLLQHLVDRLLTVAHEVLVVAAPGQDLPPTSARVIYDEAPGEGPVAGLAVGLREVGTPLAFVCTCDLPFLNPALAEYLANFPGEYDAIVPEWEGKRHPLTAVYRTATAQPVFARQLAEGRRRVTDALDHLQTRIVNEAELRHLDPLGHSFFNVNTPEDYAKAQDLWQSTASLASHPLRNT